MTFKETLQLLQDKRHKHRGKSLCIFMRVKLYQQLLANIKGEVSAEEFEFASSHPEPHLCGFPVYLVISESAPEVLITPLD